MGLELYLLTVILFIFWTDMCTYTPIVPALISCSTLEKRVAVYCQ